MIEWLRTWWRTLFPAPVTQGWDAAWCGQNVTAKDGTFHLCRERGKHYAHRCCGPNRDGNCDYWWAG